MPWLANLYCSHVDEVGMQWYAPVHIHGVCKKHGPRCSHVDVVDGPCKNAVFANGVCRRHGWRSWVNTAERVHSRLQPSDKGADPTTLYLDIEHKPINSSLFQNSFFSSIDSASRSGESSSFPPTYLDGCVPQSSLSFVWYQGDTIVTAKAWALSIGFSCKKAPEILPKREIGPGGGGRGTFDVTKKRGNSCRIRRLRLVDHLFFSMGTSPHICRGLVFEPTLSTFYWRENLWKNEDAWLLGFGWTWAACWAWWVVSSQQAAVSRHLTPDGDVPT